MFENNRWKRGPAPSSVSEGLKGKEESPKPITESCDRCWGIYPVDKLTSVRVKVQKEKRWWGWKNTYEKTNVCEQCLK